MRKITLLVILIISISLINAIDSFVVQGLKCQDVPFDDGSGLVLKWKPLPKENRIIEYRIYRGITKDSLFYLGKIDVDANTGVVGSELMFYDKDFRNFVDLESPGSLKKEKGQLKNSPIYQALPRDIKIIGPMLSRFSILAVIDRKDFFYKTTKVIKKVNDLEQLYGGLKTEQFQGIYANVLPGNRYYYTVLAVDEKRTYYPYAPIVSGISYDNKPAKPSDAYAVWVSDKQDIQVEYQPPLFVDDIANYNVYMIPKSSLPAFDNYLKYQEDIENYNRLMTLGITDAIMPVEVKNPALLIHQIPTSYPYPTETFAQIHVKAGKIVEEKHKIDANIDVNSLNDYCFFISYQDYLGFESYSNPITIKTITSTQLPVMPLFNVSDKLYDKGDMVEVRIGRPLVYITQINTDKNDKKKLTLNYEYTSNENFNVNKIKLDFYDKSNKLMGSRTEYYFDKIIKFTLPQISNFTEGFSIKFTLYSKKGDLSTEPYLQHYIRYDSDLNQLEPGDLYVGKERIMDYRFLVMKKSKADTNYRVAKKLSPYTNIYDDSIPYETMIFKTISDFDVKKNLLLIDTSIDLGYDNNLKKTIVTNLFYDEMIKTTTQKINSLKTALGKDPVGNPNAQAEIDYYQGTLDLQNSYPILKEANKITDWKERAKFLKSYRENNKRSFIYYFMKTNGKGEFTISQTYKDKDDYFFPKSEWFNTKNLPMLIASLVFGILVFYFVKRCQKGADLYIRPIAGLEEIDNAIGRATEMGRPILFVPGLSSISDVATLAGLSILGHITKKAAEYDTRIIVPVCDYIVLPIAQQIVKEAHYEAGRPDTFNSNDIFFVAEGQFAYVAGVNGVMIRQKTSTNFYMGMFYAEALIMTETGNATGAIQIAGTDALTQIPFFITTCDYTLIGEELYAASAYLAREPLILGTLKAQDYTKLIILFFIIVGSIFSSFNLNFLLNLFPTE